MTCILAADLIRATGNAVFAPALQSGRRVMLSATGGRLCKPRDVTIAGLARELGHQVAGIKAILMEAQNIS